ncbi:hypothetical protein ACHZ97_14240 [Lysobacter soli]|uniref:hypothetical protein n=1 Tax=Lysobacter soli TaxID=453783 RepID=UPI0037C754DB
MTVQLPPTRPQIQSTADHWALDFALRARWPDYVRLRDGWEKFEPETLEQVRARVAPQLKGMIEYSEGLDDFIEAQVRAEAEPMIQRMKAFAEPILSEYVTSLLLSQALCEAIINDVLAHELAARARYDVFTLIERATFLEKWMSAPRAWSDTYRFPKNGALYETLKFISGERNAYTHHKVALIVDGKSLGSRQVKPLSAPAMLDWIGRFLSLPYDLADLLLRTEQIHAMGYLLRENPIARSRLHAKDLESL